VTIILIGKQREMFASVKLIISRTSINVNYVHNNSLIVKHVVMQMNVIHVRLIIIEKMMVRNV